MTRKLAATTVALTLATAVLGGAASVATASVAPVRADKPTTKVAVQLAAQASAWGPRARFAREAARIGAQDNGVYDIQHVRELQYRLRWAHVFGGPVTGHFGLWTEQAVKRFQRKYHLPATGVATHRTWAKLIFRTVRHKGRVPAFCRTPGWHACYDRSMHQVTLWRGGLLWNSWLVRGGDYTTQTRLGTHRVYLRQRYGYSYTYHSPMPYAQYFDGGIAFHGSVYLTDPFVEHSHGCVNFYIEDARQLWLLTSTSTLWATVYGPWS